MKMHVTVYETVYHDNKHFFNYACEEVNEAYLPPKSTHTLSDDLLFTSTEEHLVFDIDIHEELKEAYLSALNTYLIQAHQKKAPADIFTIHEEILDELSTEVNQVREEIYAYCAQHLDKMPLPPQKPLHITAPPIAPPSIAVAHAGAEHFLLKKINPQIKPFTALNNTLSMKDNSLTLFYPQSTQRRKAILNFLESIEHCLHFLLYQEDPEHLPPTPTAYIASCRLIEEDLENIL